MLKRLVTLIIVLSTNLHNYSRASADCDLISSKYFQWLTANGSLVTPSEFFVNEDNLDPICPNWEMVGDSNNCSFCRESDVLVCNGSDNSSTPSARTLPTTKLSLYKISQISSLHPDSFTGLSINKLIIQNSNLTHFAESTFRGVGSIKYLHLKYNIIGQLSKADFLFQDIVNLTVMELKRNELRVLSSLTSANLPTLEYFSLSGNPIYYLNLFFLQNSGLKVLNLRKVKFRVKNVSMKYSGFSSLPHTLSVVDLSEAEISVRNINTMLEMLSNKSVTTLNLGSLVIAINTNPFILLSHVSNTLQYLSLQGTKIQGKLTLDSEEKKVIMSNTFYRLKEINMKNCGIEALGDGELFQAFPNLNVISLAGNNIVQLNLQMFSNFHTLQYLDLSSNKILQVANESVSAAESLQVVDLSNSIIDLEEMEFSRLLNTTPNVQYLSLCNAKITSAQATALQHMKNLKLLDLSGTVSTSKELYSAYTDLFASNISLEELHFTRNHFDSESNYFFIFSTLSSLKTLNLSSNTIRSLKKGMFGSQLETLVLSNNYITTWFSAIINKSERLTYLDLQDNQLTYVNLPMYFDFLNLSHLNLDNNPLLCHTGVLKIVCNTLTNWYDNSTNSTDDRWHQNKCYDIYEKSYRYFKHPNDCSQYFIEGNNENHLVNKV